MRSSQILTGVNTPRIVRLHVEAVDATEGAVAIFFSPLGVNEYHPHYGRTTTTLTNDEVLAQLRTKYLSLAVSRYAILVGVELAARTDGSGVLTATTGSAMNFMFETYQTGVFLNSSWSGDPSVAHDTVDDITDTLGTGGMRSPKTKLGIQSCIDELADVTWDDGDTTLFGASSSATTTLPDGSVTSAAPVFTTSSSSSTDGYTTSGLVATII